MSVKKINGRWHVRWTDELGLDHKKVMPDGATKEEALAFLRDVQVRVARVRAGLEVRERNPERLTLAQAATRYIEGRDYRLASTVRRHIIETPLGKLQLEHVTPARIKAHLDALAPVPRETQRTPAKLSPQTRNHVRKHLLQVFEHARARGWWSGENPVRSVAQYDVPRRQLVTLTADELGRVLAAADPPWRGIIACGAMGLRKGEIWGLDVDDVDLRRRELHVRRSHSRSTTKTGQERIVPIHPALLGAVQESVLLAKGRTCVLFPGARGGRRDERSGCARELATALKRAGVRRHLRFHDLRHTAATLLLQAGVPVAHVGRILGHSSIQMTADTYGHLQTEDLHAAMARVPLRVRK